MRFAMPLPNPPPADSNAGPRGLLCPTSAGRVHALRASDRQGGDFVRGDASSRNRARGLLEKRGYEVGGLDPSASAAHTLEGEASIGSETRQRFLARHAGVAAERMSAKGEKKMRSSFAKTARVVDGGSLASTVQARNLLRFADRLRIPRVVLVGDAKQLDAVDAGKSFAQLQNAGMKTAVMDEIMRRRDPALKAAVEASLAGDISRAFEKLGGNVAEVKADNLAGATAMRNVCLNPSDLEVFPDRRAGRPEPLSRGSRPPGPGEDFASTGDGPPQCW